MSVLGGLLRGFHQHGDPAPVTRAPVDEAKRRLADELRTGAARGGGPSLPSSS
ncbi:MAG TPA: hypothetical protein VKC64_01280 [Burkholderiales bacterium]|nr:hypothetical protein [Burkholderiales bacterium]